MKKHFFDGVPPSVFPALAEVQKNTGNLRKAIRNSLLHFDVLIGQGNRPDRIHTHLTESGVLPKFDYYFSGSRTGFEHMSHNWFEREIIDGLNEHTPYIWDSPAMWKEFFGLLDSNKNKKILVSSSAPRNEHKRLLHYPNVLFSSPTPEIAVAFGDDKRYMSELYQSLGMPYDVYNYESASSVDRSYQFYSEYFSSKTIVVQATTGSGGVTKNDKQALYFVHSEAELRNALEMLRHEGPVRVMKKYEGISSNTAALSLPYGTFISGIPSIKPCGLEVLGARPGTSGGNQWDHDVFHQVSIDAQFHQMMKVGTKMATAGYYGVFGLDPIMPYEQYGVVFNSEINARSQGPDPQRASAALQVGIVSLEELQLAYYLGCAQELFPNVDDYNLVTRWLKIPPYLKLFPKENLFVQRDFNGYWNWTKGKLVSATSKNAGFKITGAPSVGQKILRESPDNFLYIKFLHQDAKVFTREDTPSLTGFASELVNYIYASV